MRPDVQGLAAGRQAGDGGTRRLLLKIGGMQCSFCVGSVQQALSRLDGVAQVAVSLAHEEVLVRYDPGRVTAERLRDTLRSLGYTLRDPRKLRSFEEEEAELHAHRNRLALAGAVMSISLVLMIAMWAGIHLPGTRWAMPALALAMVFGVGRPILGMAWASLRRGILNQHVLMEFGAFGGLTGGAVGLFIQPWPAADFFGAAIFITAYHLLSGYVSLRVRTRSSQAIRKLMALQPATARIVRDGGEEEVPVERVRAGDRVRIRPGEGVPVDGEVVEGASAVDESLVTGESLPVDKAPGDGVIGGSINQTGTLLVRATRVGEGSFLHQVVHAVEEARALKPGIMQLVDRVLEYFVPGVLAAAAAALAFWTLGAWLLWGGPDLPRAVFATLAVLVMGYPCALGMATPLAMIRGGGMAAQRGILMRSGEAFQVFKDVRTVVLDKTGTLTRGRPVVVETVALGGEPPERVLALAAGAEAPSEHPLARAIVEHARDRGLRIPAASDFEAVVGRGVRATVQGLPVRVERPRADGHPRRGAADEALARLEAQGHTVVAVVVAGRVAGLIAISDTLKPDAREAVARMKAAGLTPVMITGDNRRTAAAIARQAGIEEVFAEVLPAEKADHIRRLQAGGRRVAMVGDGINDAPALMQADVGIAIGTGTDIAMESADIVLIGDRLGGVVDAYTISIHSYRKTVQNVTLAFAFNGIGVPAAITGLVHPVMAMIAMAASVTTVLLNSFAGRLLPQRRPPARPAGAARTLTLSVPTLHCEGCLAQVREALAALPGVAAVSGDLAHKRIEVHLRDPAPGREALCEALRRIGHLCGD